MALLAGRRVRALLGAVPSNGKKRAKRAAPRIDTRMALVAGRRVRALVGAAPSNGKKCAN